MNATLKTYPIPLRLDRDLRRRIDIASRRLHAPRSTIMRMALLNILGDIESGVIRFQPAGIQLASSK